jgi:hypothetical protein
LVFHGSVFYRKTLDWGGFQRISTVVKKCGIIPENERALFHVRETD